MDNNRIRTNKFTKGLVSILTPCYNTEKYISRLMDSILKQSYPSIEMYAINDGSTDNTLDILKSYIEKFENKGYHLSIITQKNQGQSYAINKGLKLVHGEYLVWPDSDDFYNSEYAIEKMVNELKYADNDVGMVRVQEYIVDENDLHIISINGKKSKTIEDRSLFEECLYAKSSFYFPPGAYMIKTNILDAEVNMEIYTEKKAGQNWQIYLPILVNHKCITIQKPLYSVLKRKSSHSRGQFKCYNELKQVMISYENTIINTLERIKSLDNKTQDNYINKIRIKYGIDRFLLSLKYSEEKDIELNRYLLKQLNTYGFGLKCIYFIYRIPLLCKSTSFLCRIYRRFKF